MKMMYKSILLVFVVVALLVGSIVPCFAESSDEEFVFDGLFSGADVYAKVMIKNIVSGSTIIDDYNHLTCNQLNAGMSFKDWWNSDVDGSYDQDYEYVKWYDIYIYFDQAVPYSLATFYISQHSILYDLYVKFYDENHDLVDCAVDYNESGFYRVVPQSFGADDASRIISCIELTLYAKDDRVGLGGYEPYDFHLASYNTFKNPPFSIFYDTGYLQYYESGFEDGLTVGKAQANRDSEKVLADIKNQHYLEMADLIKQHRSEMADVISQYEAEISSIRSQMTESIAQVSDRFYREGYEKGSLEGRALAREEGYLEGYNDGNLIGFQAGLESAADADFNGDFTTLFYSFLDAPVQIISGFLNFDLLGINLLSFFSAVFTLLLFVFILKKVL